MRTDPWGLVGWIFTRLAFPATSLGEPVCVFISFIRVALANKTAGVEHKMTASF
jgi:hypothetical protein